MPAHTGKGAFQSLNVSTSGHYFDGMQPVKKHVLNYSSLLLHKKSIFSAQQEFERNVFIFEKNTWFVTLVKHFYVYVSIFFFLFHFLFVLLKRCTQKMLIH